MIGSPLPCGVAITRAAYVARIARSVEYVGVMDTTLTGSRSALAPLILWAAFERRGEEGYRAIVREALGVAAYAVERFRALGIPAWRHRNSVTGWCSRGRRPQVVAKWQLAPQGGHRPRDRDAARHARADSTSSPKTAAGTRTRRRRGPPDGGPRRGGRCGGGRRAAHRRQHEGTRSA